jgi:hypothetical protein
MLKPILVNPISSETEQVKAARLTDTWETLRQALTPDIISLASTIYWMALEHYTDRLRPLPLQHLARNYNKRWAGMLKRHSLEATGIELRTLIECLELSKSIPISLSKAPRGGILVLPSIVGRTYMSRMMRGEPVPDMQAMLEGRVDGPSLSPAGMALANEPFDNEMPVVEPQAVPEPAEILNTAQKFATVPKPALGESIPAVFPSGDTSVAESSTDESDTP